MNPPYKVVWTDRALADVLKIRAYMEDIWSSREVNSFLDTLAKKEQLISKQPRAFPLLGTKKEVRYTVLSKQVTIYYRIESNPERVRILSVFDTRQDPEKLNLG